MPTFHFSLLYNGIDIDDDDTLDLLSAAPEIAWLSNHGAVYAIAVVEAASALKAAQDVVRTISAIVPTASPVRVEEDLVAVTDIATRVGVSRESVRLWVENKRGPGGFPCPRGHVGGDAQRVWDWGSVQRWLRENYRLGGDDRVPDWRETAEINSFLSIAPAVASPQSDSTWTASVVATASLVMARSRPLKQRWLVTT